MELTTRQLIMDENRARRDFKIWIAMIFLCCFGLMIIYSASSYEYGLKEKVGYDSMYLMKNQLKFMILGIVAAFALQFENYNHLRRPIFCWLIYGGSIACILALLTPLGIEANGAVRWIRMPGFQFQVAEVVKIGVIVMLANLANKYSTILNRRRVAFRMWVAGMIPAGLLFKISNDMSSALVVAGITFLLSLICTRTYKEHVFVGALGFGAAFFYVWRIASNLPTQEMLDEMAFRDGRIAAWIAPERYAAKQGYQVLQALYAIGSGGWLGKGLGNSVQKLSAIPESQNDMIFSIICEELGIVGAAALLLLFAYLLYQIFRVSFQAENLFGAVLAGGVFLHIGLQVIINVAVNVNLFPNTGLSLPFISYGGSAVLCLILEIAMVLSIERQRVVHSMRREAGLPIEEPKKRKKKKIKISNKNKQRRR